MNDDTIAAISTGGTSSGINIIRISGKNAIKFTSKIFSNGSKLKAGKIVHGYIINPLNKIRVDEVLVSCFIAPKSYTGENTCEINSHGGRVVTEEILKLLLNLGVRLAQPGEFSKRAFLNGKMDLSRAEAITDIITAKTKLQAEIASNNMQGVIEDRIKEIKNKIIDIIAQAEVSIDYPEYDYEELDNSTLNNKLQKIIEQVNELIHTHENTKYVKEGVNIAILGATNAGKSSLLNRLTNSDRAIVTEIEGTTRDIVNESIILNNIVVNIFDSAGLRDTKDQIEAIGIQKSLDLINKVDFIIYLIDFTKGISEKDEEILHTLVVNKKQHVECLNKLDLGLSYESDFYDSLVKKVKIRNNSGAIFGISTKTGEGIEKLCEYMSNLFSKGIGDGDEKIIVNARHNNILKIVNEKLQQAVSDVQNNKSIDIVCISLNEAIYNLGSITGESANEEVVQRIFERFCLGK